MREIVGMCRLSLHANLYNERNVGVSDSVEAGSFICLRLNAWHLV